MPVSAYGTYQVVPAAGGAWHVYSNGRRVFVKAGAAAPAAPAAPAAVDYTPGGGGEPAPAAAPAPPVPKPRESYTPDAQYYAEQAQRLLRKNQGLSANEQQGTRNVTGYREALRQMAQQQPRDEGNAKVSANRSGLFYGSALGNQLGDLARTYVERRSKTQTTYDDAERARAAARAAIEQGYTVDDAAAYAASIDRQISRDTGAADAGALVAETPVAQASDAVYGQVAPAVQASSPIAAPRVVRTVRQPTTRTTRTTRARRPRRR